ncbi:hypothetical protein FRC16_004358, partial [Serendipita sp. 398]
LSAVKRLKPSTWTRQPTLSRRLEKTLSTPLVPALALSFIVGGRAVFQHQQRPATAAAEQLQGRPGILERG